MTPQSTGQVPLGATVYLDTNALIYIIEGSLKFKATIEAFLRHAVAPNARLVTSELAITESLVLPLREQNTQLLIAYNELFDSFVHAEPIGRSILIRAAQMRAATKSLRTPDAIHLATAEKLQAALFVTGDVRLIVMPPMVRILLNGGSLEPRT